MWGGLKALAGSMGVLLGMLASPALAGHPAGVGSAALESGIVPEEVRAVLGGDVEPLRNGLYRVYPQMGPPLTTHGPDPKSSHEGALEGHGTSLGPGDPRRDPVCATDYYQHILYGRPAGTPQGPGAVQTIRNSIKRINAVLNEEALQAGASGADYKLLCDSSGEIRVDSFTSASLTYAGIVSAARVAGFDAPNADYTIFFDASPQGACGVGSYQADPSLSSDNANNFGGGYALVYDACWRTDAAMHENGHNQGAVQYSAPYSTGTGGHCYDELDVMCYSPDGGDLNQAGAQTRCTDALHFDCANDTYFDPAPETGEYLATHWNLGSRLNRYISFPGAGEPPIPGFGFSCEELACSFADASSDPDGSIAGWLWSFGDGAEIEGGSAQHTYAAAGTYPVMLTVTDDDAITTSSTRWVPAGTRQLKKRAPLPDLSGEPGTWVHYRIDVPRRRSRLSIALDRNGCEGAECPAGLDLYLTRKRRPGPGDAPCASSPSGLGARCRVKQPRKGTWYAGVRNAGVGGGTPFVITARFAR